MRTPEQEQAIVEAYKEGTPVAIICKAHKVARSILYTILDRHHIPRRYHPVSTKTRAQAVEMYLAGALVVDILDELHIRAPSLYDALDAWADDQGLPHPPRRYS